MFQGFEGLRWVVDCTTNSCRSSVESIPSACFSVVDEFTDGEGQCTLQNADSASCNRNVRQKAWFKRCGVSSLVVIRRHALENPTKHLEI